MREWLYYAKGSKKSVMYQARENMSKGRSSLTSVNRNLSMPSAGNIAKPRQQYKVIFERFGSTKKKKNSVCLFLRLTRRVQNEYLGTHTE